MSKEKYTYIYSCTLTAGKYDICVRTLNHETPEKLLPRHTHTHKHTYTQILIHTYTNREVQSLRKDIESRDTKIARLRALFSGHRAVLPSVSVSPLSPPVSPKNGDEEESLGMYVYVCAIFQP
jgi:hypothetical protein